MFNRLWHKFIEGFFEGLGITIAVFLFIFIVGALT